MRVPFARANTGTDFTDYAREHEFYGVAYRPAGPSTRVRALLDDARTHGAERNGLRWPILSLLAL